MSVKIKEIQQFYFRIPFLSQVVINEAKGTYLPEYWLPLLKIVLKTEQDQVFYFFFSKS